MVIDGSYTCGEHSIKSQLVASLCCTSETNGLLCVNSTSSKTDKKSLCFCTLRTNYLTKKQEMIPFTTAAKTLLRNKLNQGSERSLHWKTLISTLTKISTQDTDEIHKKEDTVQNGKVSHVHGSEELIFL